MAKNTIETADTTEEISTVTTNDFISETTDIDRLQQDLETASTKHILSSKPHRRHSTGTFVSDTEMSQREKEFSDKCFPLYSKRISRQYSQENFIQNREAIKCSRFHSRRNALCDPLRLLIPQRLREQLEQDVQKRKTSVTRKVSQFLTVSLDLNRDEELI